MRVVSPALTSPPANWHTDAGICCVSAQGSAVCLLFLQSVSCLRGSNSTSFAKHSSGQCRALEGQPSQKRAELLRLLDGMGTGSPDYKASLVWGASRWLLKDTVSTPAKFLAPEKVGHRFCTGLESHKANSHSVSFGSPSLPCSNTGCVLSEHHARLPTQ